MISSFSIFLMKYDNGIIVIFTDFINSGKNIERFSKSCFTHKIIDSNTCKNAKLHF